MTTITIDDELQSRFLAVAAPEEDIIALARAAMTEFIARRERQAAGRAEMQAMLDGPWHPAAEVNERIRSKYGYPDLSHMTTEELSEDAERALAAMNPAVREKMEREGLL